MIVQWLPVAEHDRESQVDYIANRNPKAAIEMGDIVVASAAALGEFPHMGRPGRVTGTRELVLVGTPFILVYRVEVQAVVILRLMHGAQQCPAER